MAQGVKSKMKDIQFFIRVVCLPNEKIKHKIRKLNRMRKEYGETRLNRIRPWILKCFAEQPPQVNCASEDW